MSASQPTIATDLIKIILEEHPIDPELSPSRFISHYWDLYAGYRPTDINSSAARRLNGNVFEELLIISLIRENITPVYVQAKLAFVPNVILDIVLYNRKTPITISAKTTLRERWKQADLEAMATKYVHREAKCYVVTLSEDEVRARRREENCYMGLNRFVLANTPEYDELINELREINFSESEEISIIQTNDRLHRRETLEELYQITL